MTSNSKRTKFIMEPDWIFNGVIDTEHKEYVLMGYFQKLNKFLEEIKLYPMFTELSIHLGNIQTLITQKKLLKCKKKTLSPDDELSINDLEIMDIPNLEKSEIEELKKILQNSQPKLFDYFNIVKAIWTLVYDSIIINIKRNHNNLNSKNGFFYLKKNNLVYIWKYTIKESKKINNQIKTNIKIIYEGEMSDLTIPQLLFKFSKTYKSNNEKSYPIFEINPTQDFPIYETLIPVAKRKIVSLIYQSIRIEKIEKQKKLLENGI